MEEDEIPLYTYPNEQNLIVYTPPTGSIGQASARKQDEMVDLIS